MPACLPRCQKLGRIELKNIEEERRRSAILVSQRTQYIHNQVSLRKRERREEEGLKFSSPTDRPADRPTDLFQYSHDMFSSLPGVVRACALWFSIADDVGHALNWERGPHSHSHIHSLFFPFFFFYMYIYLVCVAFTCARSRPRKPNGVVVWCGVVWCGVVWCGVVCCVVCLFERRRQQQQQQQQQ